MLIDKLESQIEYANDKCRYDLYLLLVEIKNTLCNLKEKLDGPIEFGENNSLDELLDKIKERVDLYTDL